MFDNLLIITLFLLLASLLVCLLTLTLSINIKHLSLFSFIADINGFKILKLRPLVYFDPLPPFIKFNKDLQSPRLLGT